MAPTYDDGPELAPESQLEVAPRYEPQRAIPPAGQYHSSHPPTPVKYEQSQYTNVPAHAPGATYSSVDPSVYTSSHAPPTPYSMPAEPIKSERRSGATICGCTLLVFVLSAIIAMLGAAVIGLAAGVGIEANRVNDANDKLAQASASLAGPARTVTVTGSPPSVTKFSELDNNCSSDPDSVTDQTYTSFKLFGQQTFSMHCNRDTPYSPLFSLFVSDFNSCMDACSSYNKYEPNMFGNNTNTTCAAVSFIPLWTQKANASAGGAPGNCYLKPAPQNKTGLSTPNIGTECHAAVLTSR